MRDTTLSLSLGLGAGKSSVSSSTYKLNLVLVVTIVLLAFSYLFQMNSLGTKGYEIKKVEQQIQKLEQQQKVLQLESADLQSIDRIQTEATKLNFVPSTSVTFIKDGNFALK